LLGIPAIYRAHDWLVIGAVVSILVGINIIYILLGRIDPSKNYLPKPELGLSVIILFSVIIGVAVIFTYISVIIEYTPTSHFVEKFDRGNMSLVIDREPTILIPLKRVAPFPSFNTSINANVYHNINTTIQAVKLSSTDSILSYPPNFQPVNSILIDNIQRDNYTMTATANHNLQISNVTGVYTMDVLYSNKTSDVLQKWSEPFNWPTRTMDMSIYSYFWIVLIGVMVSRLLTLVLRTLGSAQPAAGAAGAAGAAAEPVKLTTYDYIWIAFSFIIAILIFSGFSTQVKPTLTTSILANISLAFGFGFGFDKVLEVATRFQSLAK
jgi:hypothetical protein